ncbi:MULTISPECIES: hypothetical protein [unclassified Variovorax]|uniref:hypothetical protein n=1 Tax=unclassified Variovorax TaxID=663243 RepID=UPI000839A2F4|nr:MULTISPECIES: hypothetical protein [unclassified Variovorax]PNG52161.1 hypothetical protein CHC07_04532 [Variovorax sp. B4]PNG54701.1 hypothetical protein CHC06_03498 [Variovorax sp. B2]VTV15690.1 hypothetical protein WDL1CHR_06071 [Variovorax sp. WDL1]
MGGWLTVAPSGALHLDNVPTKSDIPVKDVLELMMMESPHTAMRLALDLFGGFSGVVKRSAHIDWTTPRAIQALCAIQGYAVQLEAAGDPTAALAKKVTDKFRKRLTAAWAGLDSAARATSLSALLAELDGRELATARELLPPLDMQVIDFDSALRQWITERLVAAFDAGSGEGARVAMRRCGVLGVALAPGNRRAESFIGGMLSSLVNDQSNRTQDDDILLAFLSMLEEADYQVFANLALSNATAGPGEMAGSLIVQTHAGGQVDAVPGPLADRFRALTREWLSTKYSVPLSQDPYVLALNQIIPPASQPVLGATSFDYLQAMSRAMLPDASPQGAWLAQLREGAAKLVGADPPVGNFVE